MTTEQMVEAQPIYTAKRHSCLFGLPLTLTHYVIDGESLSERTGLFAVTAKAVSVSRVRNMMVVQSPLEKLFGLFTVRVATADPAIPEFLVRGIRDGVAFAQALKQTLEPDPCLRQSAAE